MKLGDESLIGQNKILRHLKSKRVGLVCHPASVDHKLQHALDFLSEKIKFSCVFGPQHGARGEKQYNMIESNDYIDLIHKIPVFSLYGKVRKPTEQMMQHFDSLLFDLQDLGCRIYTFITTLLYLMQACAEHHKELIILDRPNPAGRAVEGLALQPGWESFVGAAPIPMRHGLTIGELALYYQKKFNLNLNLRIIKMSGYKPNDKPGYGWPADLPWVNPSPNASTLNMARVYSGTVLIEGTHLSEGRGTTRALEVVGAPGLDFLRIYAGMQKKSPQGKRCWLQGIFIRPCYFEPTFYKYKGELCYGLQLHTDFPGYRPTLAKPYRVIALLLKTLREIYPDYDLYRNFTYEYVENKLAFDVINGGPRLRDWIDDPSAHCGDLQKMLLREENEWRTESAEFHLY